MRGHLSVSKFSAPDGLKIWTEQMKSRVPTRLMAYSKNTGVLGIVSRFCDNGCNDGIHCVCFVILLILEILSTAPWGTSVEKQTYCAIIFRHEMKKLLRSRSKIRPPTKRKLTLCFDTLYWSYEKYCYGS